VSEVRLLTRADLDEILAVVTFDRLSASTVARELANADDYCWVGLVTPAGHLLALHRSMRWGRHLLLKGVSVGGSARGSGAVLRLAFALRDIARDRGYAGLAAWVEPHEPEAGLARILRLRGVGPLLHRFEIPIGSGGAGRDRTGERTVAFGSGCSAGTAVVRWSDEPGAAPIVANLLGADPLVVHWVVDGRRLVLSGCPWSVLGQLSRLPATIEAGPDVEAAEVPLPAADLLASFHLLGMKARRVSRTPVRLSRLDFS
jgi:hypothetical protein